MCRIWYYVRRCMACELSVLFWQASQQLPVHHSLAAVACMV
jgi:hypothetical protein